MADSKFLKRPPGLLDNVTLPEEVEKSFEEDELNLDVKFFVYQTTHDRKLLMELLDDISRVGPVKRAIMIAHAKECIKRDIENQHLKRLQEAEKRRGRACRIVMAVDRSVEAGKSVEVSLSELRFKGLRGTWLSEASKAKLYKEGLQLIPTRNPRSRHHPQKLKKNIKI